MREKCQHGDSDRYQNGRCRACKQDERQRRSEQRKAYNREWNRTVRGRAGALLTRVRERSQEKGFPAPTLDADWIEARLERGVCELSGLPFGDEKPYAPSIDRIDSSKPYTQENCRLVVWALNAAFGEWGEEAFRLIAKTWLARRPGCDLI